MTRRRATTRVERRALVEELLTADPTVADRAIARRAGVSHPMVIDARKRLVATGAIPARANLPAPVEPVLVPGPNGGYMSASVPGNAKNGVAAQRDRRYRARKADHLVQLRADWPDETLADLEGLARVAALIDIHEDRLDAPRSTRKERDTAASELKTLENLRAGKVAAFKANSAKRDAPDPFAALEAHLAEIGGDG